MTIQTYERVMLERPEFHLQPWSLLFPVEQDCVRKSTREQLEAFCTGMILSGTKWFMIEFEYDPQEMEQAPSPA